MTHTIIDRRPNSNKGKSTVNRKKFIDRVKTKIRETVRKSIKEGKITDIVKNKKEKINIPKKDIEEPTFTHKKSGTKRKVLPGNKEYIPGDKIPKPPESEGTPKASNESGNEDDNFEFQLTNEEYMDIFFEDLELPNLEEKSIATIDNFSWQRSGYTTDGDYSNLDLLKSMKEASGRRKSLCSMKNKKLKELNKEKNIIEEFINNNPLLECLNEKQRLIEIEEEIKKIKIKINNIPFIDEMDLKFKNKIKVPSPITQAVMFAIMDISGSMSEWHKEMAKRFFMLLYIFLNRSYKKIDIVFIRHHTESKEVTEEEFFYNKETGGTLVSPALELTMDIIKKRYPTNNWNIYCAQASDGDNWAEDNENVISILEKQLLPIIKYYSYIEINERDGDLWLPYSKLMEKHKDKFSIAKIKDIGDIFPVFRELFKK